MSVITKKPLICIVAIAGIVLFICSVVSTERVLLGLFFPHFEENYKIAAKTSVFSMGGVFILIAGLGWIFLKKRARVLTLAMSLILSKCIYGTILKIDNYELLSMTDTASISVIAFDCANVLPCETVNETIDTCMCKDDSIRLNKNILTSLRFDTLGHAYVFADSQWILIDKAGNVVLQGVVAVDNGPDYPSDNLIRFRKDGKWGYANTGGVMVIPAKYDGAMPFKNGIASVCIGCKVKYSGEYMLFDGGRKFSIDTLGNVIQKKQIL